MSIFRAGSSQRYPSVTKLIKSSKSYKPKTRVQKVYYADSSSKKSGSKSKRIKSGGSSRKYPDVVEVIKSIPKPQAGSIKTYSYDSLNFAQKIDVKLFKGHLPGGVSPTQVDTKRLLKKGNDLVQLDKAQTFSFPWELKTTQQQEIQNNQLDLIENSWYEKFGLFQDEQEKTIQNLQREQAYNQQGLLQLPQTVNAVERYETYIRETPGAQDVLSNATPSNLSKYLLIGGAVIIGMIMFKRR